MLYMVTERFRPGNSAWEDLVDFELLPVITASEAAERMAAGCLRAEEASSRAEHASRCR